MFAEILIKVGPVLCAFFLLNTWWQALLASIVIVAARRYIVALVCGVDHMDNMDYTVFQTIPEAQANVISI